MVLRVSLKTTVFVCLAFAIGSLGPVESAAQGIGERRAQTFEGLSGFDLNPLQGMTRLSRINEIVPMEGAVNAEEYIVGPGDLFDISVGGPQPIMVSIPVSADGYLLLPDAGAVSVAGSALVDARQRARTALLREFENVRVEVTLSQPRQFYVHVSGAIPTPGRYVATPVARVATVLNMAYVDTTRAPVSNRDLRPALRNIKLIHQDGTSERVDILKYFATGNPNYNPYLRDGDVISVPTYNPAYGAVFVSGDLPYPGTYDYRPDDSVYDLLVLATGEDPPTGFSQVRVLRTNDDGTTSASIHDLKSLDRSLTVAPRDQVHAVQDPTVRGAATIEGWVQYPGTYPILPGKSTLSELVDMAGGLREGALARGAYLQRATLPLPEPQTDRRNRFELAAQDVRMLRADSLAIMQNTRLARLDFMSRAYLAHELELQNRVPINLSTLNGGSPTRLQDGDKVFVPRDQNNVFVFGQVNRPGYVPYAPGASFEHYVSESGGLGDNAGAAYVIEAGTGTYLDAVRAQIQSGDKIFVDRAIMHADTQQLQRLLTESRRADLEERSRTVTSIVQSVSAVTAVITTYLLVRREFNN